MHAQLHLKVSLLPHNFCKKILDPRWLSCQKNIEKNRSTFQMAAQYFGSLNFYLLVALFLSWRFQAGGFWYRQIIERRLYVIFELAKGSAQSVVRASRGQGWQENIILWVLAPSIAFPRIVGCTGILIGTCTTVLTPSDLYDNFNSQLLAKASKGF